MTFKEFLKNAGIISESKTIINNSAVFKNPTSIKGELVYNDTDNDVDNFFRNQGKDSARSKYRRIPLNKHMIPKISEILECVHHYCNLELNSSINRYIIIDNRKKNTNMFKYLGLEFNNKTDINKVIKYIFLAITPNNFNADYGDDQDWLFEFVIRNFPNKKHIANHFKKIDDAILKKNGRNLLIKMTFRSIAHKTGILPSSDNYIYINSKFMVLRDISMHLIKSPH